MKRNFKLFAKIGLFCLMAFPVLIFAETVSDSLGNAGKQMAAWLASFGFEHAVEIVSSMSLLIGWGFTRLFAFIVKKTPTTWYWNEQTQSYAVSAISKVLSGLFGKRVLYYNPKFTGSGDIAEDQKKKIIQEYLQQHSKEITVEVK